jgi:hypothetical protein
LAGSDDHCRCQYRAIVVHRSRRNAKGRPVSGAAVIQGEFAAGTVLLTACGCASGKQDWVLPLENDKEPVLKLRRDN